MPVLYSLTILVGALLLFGVQPMFARLILPLLGGSPAVWNTAMVFFQTALLAGYLYAHASMRRLGARRQSRWHLVVLLLPLAVLPLAVPSGWTPPVDRSPIPWLFALMIITVGLPFFVLSTTSPLLQAWFARGGHRGSRDPYFLYAASNVGSLLSLLAYPVLIEPSLPLASQTRLWTVGYVIYAVLVAICALRVRQDEKVESPVVATPAPNTTTRARWVMLSALPSSLLLGVTTYISSEVAVVPMLWVIPLALYLLTFVLAFANRQWVSAGALARALPFVLVPVAMLMAAQTTEPILLLAAAHLLLFFITAWLCHARLAAMRPAADHLTEFYLWLSVGGVLGGAFNALLAPLMFSTVVEYPLGIVLICLVALPAATNTSRRARLGDWLWPLLLVALATALVLAANTESLRHSAAIAQLAFGALAVVCFLFSKRPLRLALGLAVLLLAGTAVRREASQVLAIRRSFFGVHRVLADEAGGIHRLIHGRVSHGAQSLDPARRREPLTYYHPSGPVGQLMAVFGRKPHESIAVVGLGAGSMATYALPGQSWRFYEIDPEVLELATDTTLFTFLHDSRGQLDYVLGDARLSLVSAREGEFDLLVLDAYSSDAIPVHLVTREALALYLRKLSPGGVLVFHISNLHLDLEPVFGNLAADAGLVALVRDDADVPAEHLAAGKATSTWLVMARTAENLAPLAHDPRWQRPRTDPKLAVWTDDHSSLLDVIKWR